MYPIPLNIVVTASIRNLFNVQSCINVIALQQVCDTVYLVKLSCNILGDEVVNCHFGSRQIDGFRIFFSQMLYHHLSLPPRKIQGVEIGAFPC